MWGFSKILIANRGEIAIRVITAARALGYQTVAVFCEVDRDTPHVRLADQACCIGSGSEPSAYLDIERLLAACKRVGADAIHPGYGFLSENADFAAACEAAGIVFIGPSSGIIRLMADKAKAKQKMAASGVPCVPGYDGDDQSDEMLLHQAASIGFPIMIKASHGGGGRGMRLVHEREEFLQQVEIARREALGAFGSGDVILERAIQQPRHIEIQIMGDRFGTVLHFGERDCSVQRRHQKVIEEAPSTAVSAGLRERMTGAAVEGVRSIGYVGAGTLEFLVDRSGEFYFLEMNTRIQVEHPVTEMVTGRDLVALQIAVAAGEALPIQQDEITISGHAIEARLYAEDTAIDFLPQSGRIARADFPVGPDLRVDHWIENGQMVSPHYDPMLAKLIAHGRTREEARRRLLAGLRACTVFGLTSNRDFLIACLEDGAFVDGEIDTSFIQRRLSNREPPSVTKREGAFAAMAWYVAQSAEDPMHLFAPAWSAQSRTATPIRLVGSSVTLSAALVAHGEGRFTVLVGDETVDVQLFAASAGELRCMMHEVVETVRYSLDGNTLWLDFGGRLLTFDNDLSLSDEPGQGASTEGGIIAPMSGLIVAVHVTEGQLVSRGEALVTISAMKMEHRVAAPFDGTVVELTAIADRQVDVRALLARIEAA